MTVGLGVILLPIGPGSMSSSLDSCEVDSLALSS